MQRLWQQRVMWYEPLDEGILEEWTAILADIGRSSVISIKRAFFKILHHPTHCSYTCSQMPAPKHMVQWPIYLT